MTTPNELLSIYSTQSQISSFFTDKMLIYSVKSYGAKCDNVTDDTTAINNTIIAVNASGGGIVYFPDNCMVTGTIALLSNVVLIGYDITLKAGASISGNSSVISASSIDNAYIIGITFNANGYRRWGFYADSGCTNIFLHDVDAKYYTDKYGQGIKVPDNSIVELKRLPRIRQVIYTSSSASTASGSLPAATYRISVCGVDALGREAPLYLYSSMSDKTLASAGKLTIAWNKDNSARSYRVYVGDSVSADWMKFYTVPVTNDDPATYTYDVTGNYATFVSTVAVATGAGTFTDKIYTDYQFRLSAYYTDGMTNHTGNSVIPVNVTINDTSTVANLTWVAPTGVAPDGYILFVSSQDTGGLRNFEKMIDVGAVTSYSYTGQTGFIMYPFGNSDEVVCDGYSYRNLGGSGKAIFNGQVFVGGERTGRDSSVQIAGYSDGTGTAVYSDQFTGLSLRLKQIAGTLAREWWTLGMWGNGTNLVIGNTYPTPLSIMTLTPTYILTPYQARASAYANANFNITADGNWNLLSTELNTEDFDVGANFASSVFTCPVAGIYRVNFTVSCYGKSSPVVLTLGARIRKNISSPKYWENGLDITPTATNRQICLSVDGLIQCAVSDTIRFEVRAFNTGSTDTVAIVGDANRSTRVSIELVG